jgi:hypothetical protein
MGCAANIYKQNRQGFPRMPRKTPKNTQRKSTKLLENKDWRDGPSGKAYKHHRRSVGAKQLIAPGNNGPMLADLRVRGGRYRDPIAAANRHSSLASADA